MHDEVLISLTILAFLAAYLDNFEESITIPAGFELVKFAGLMIQLKIS